jgi:carboxypeptidase T
MKKAVRIFILSLACAVAAAQPVEVYKQIRIDVPDRATLARILSSGVDACAITGKVGGPMEFVAGPYEVQQLRAQGTAFEVLVEDLASWYQLRTSPVPENALGFGYGSMGGFYTNAEVNQQLDSMHLLYPSLITARESVGVSVEGRTMWAVKISDNPGVNESGEPEVLYTALHHAREPEGMMSVLYYMWWLLQNYGSNPIAAYLVNARQMWFIPVMNVDGYVYNQTTNPGGGGMWRKNRRNNGGSFGVDLNRNYGPVYMWNAPNGGSSTSPLADTYRGPSAFSEPENRAIDAFIRAHNFKTAFNYHTYSNLLIYPWGYLSQESRDSLLFRDWAYEMTAVNKYIMGTDLQTVNYSTRGNSDDYMYGDSTKPRVFALTPEVGSDAAGFWPTIGEILPLAVENLTSNQFLSYAAGFLPRLRGTRVLEADSNGSIIAGESFALAARFRNVGVGASSGLSIEATTDVPWVTFSPSAVAVGVFVPQTETEIRFQGTVDPLAPSAGVARVFLRSTDLDGIVKTDTVRLYAGQATLLLADSARTGTSNWSTGTGWGTTALAHTPPLAFTDSPSGNYLPSTINSLTMLGTANLSSYQYAELRFWTRWSVEPTWDFATVEVSTNSGTSWTVLRTEMSRTGSGISGGQQPLGSFGYDSYTPGLTWVEQTADLSSYAGRQIKIRFRMASDSGVERDGIYLDDIRIYAYNTTIPPVAPALVAPVDGASSVSTTAVLRWHATGGAAAYQVQVSADSLFSSMGLNDSTVADTARSVSGLATDATYFWRVRARNGAGAGPLSPVWRFTTVGSLTRTYPMEQFWNLVSVPVAVSNPAAGAIFPGASSSIYAFQPALGYILEDTLRHSSGYWAKFDTATTVEIAGIPFAEDTIPLVGGWNMIGSLTEPLASGSVVQVPPGILQSAFYTFTGPGSYVVADTLRPARGYWVKAGQAGELILRVPGARSAVRSTSDAKRSSVEGRR